MEFLDAYLLHIVVIIYQCHFWVVSIITFLFQFLNQEEKIQNLIEN